MKKMNRKNKDRYDSNYGYEDEDSKPKKKEDTRRRPIKNWTKAWNALKTDWDEFFND